MRISTKTHDPNEAEEQKEDLEAKLRLGLEPARTVRSCGPAMPWVDSRALLCNMRAPCAPNCRATNGCGPTDGVLPFWLAALPP